MNIVRERFLKHNIPYDDLDFEMIEIIDVLNFHLGFTTEFCCYGHDNKTRTYIIFNESVTDEQILSLAELVSLDWKNHIFFYKWVRGVNGEIKSNWKLEISLLFEDPYNPRKKAHLDKIVELLKSI